MNAVLEAAIKRTGRSCGTCSLCCKLPAIAELNKLPNKWCAHCKPGKGGCGIYEARPERCRNFGCGWLTNLALDDEWFPARAKLYLTHTQKLDGQLDVLVSVDPTSPNRWREPPYYERILQLARERGQVVVSVGSQVHTIRPRRHAAEGQQ